MTSIKWTGGSMETAIRQVAFPQDRDDVAARLRDSTAPVDRSDLRSA